jgi:hypothetical protein
VTIEGTLPVANALTDFPVAVLVGKSG